MAEGREEKGREGKGGEGMGWDGEGMGWEGKGREGKGREGKGAGAASVVGAVAELGRAQVEGPLNNLKRCMLALKQPR